MGLRRPKIGLRGSKSEKSPFFLIFHSIINENNGNYTAKPLYMANKCLLPCIKTYVHSIQPEIVKNEPEMSLNKPKITRNLKKSAFWLLLSLLEHPK